MLSSNSSNKKGTSPINNPPISTAKRSPSILVTDVRKNQIKAPFAGHKLEQLKKKKEKSNERVSNLVQSMRRSSNSKYSNISVSNLTSNISDIPSSRQRETPKFVATDSFGSRTYQKVPQYIKNLPSRTSKVTQKLVLIPENEIKTLQREESTTDNIFQEVYSRTKAEKLTKEQREHEYPRVTAYLIAEGFNLKLTSKFLAKYHMVLPRLYDEVLYIPYSLPLLPGENGYRVQSNNSLKMQRGIKLMEHFINKSEERDHHYEFYSGNDNESSGTNLNENGPISHSPNGNSDFNPSEPQFFVSTSPTESILEREMRDSINEERSDSTDDSVNKSIESTNTTSTTTTNNSNTNKNNIDNGNSTITFREKTHEDEKNIDKTETNDSNNNNNKKDSIEDNNKINNDNSHNKNNKDINNIQSDATDTVKKETGNDPSSNSTNNNNNNNNNTNNNNTNEKSTTGNKFPISKQKHSHLPDLTKHAEMFILDYGVVVFWNFSEIHEKNILADLVFAKIEPGEFSDDDEDDDDDLDDDIGLGDDDDYDIAVDSMPPMKLRTGSNSEMDIDDENEQDEESDEDPLSLIIKPLSEHDIETEEFHFEYNKDVPTPRIYNDMITLKSGDHLIKLTMSHAIAQSTKLSLFESKMSHILNSISKLPKALALTGRLQNYTTKRLLTKTGRLFQLRSEVNLLSNVLDTPEYFWSIEPGLHPLYTAVRDYLEIEQRVEVINDRCKVFLDFFDILSDSLAERKMTKITKMLIFAIGVSVIVSMIEILVRYAIISKFTNRN